MNDHEPARRDERDGCFVTAAERGLQHDGLGRPIDRGQLLLWPLAADPHPHPAREESAHDRQDP